jgi:uncharacterized protein
VRDRTVTDGLTLAWHAVTALGDSVGSAKEGAMARIGLIADTHDGVVPWEQVHEKVADAFEGVEQILHCGDLTSLGVLDRLGSIAPVVAVRSSGDPEPAPPRLFDGPHVVEVEGTVIGLINRLGDEASAVFGRPVDVIVHGGTHAASVDLSGSVLLVNPGSPTLSDQVTVAVLETGDSPRAVIIAL